MNSKEAIIQAIDRLPTSRLPDLLLFIEILCKITSQNVRDIYGVEIGELDFVSGGLSKISNVIHNRLFTADRSIFLYKAGELSVEKLQLAIEQLITIFRGD
jgi:mRNA interferase MazF